MEYKMKLHTDKKLFRQTISSATAHLKINQVFVEKDYWITLVLNRLANSKYATATVFKGGTSLSKGFGLINRFSEDVDIAIVDENNKSGNEIKTIIRTVEKEMTKELTELDMPEVTSKGSMFRKSVFEYESIDVKNKGNRLIVEVNSFANPFLYQSIMIKSLVYDFLYQTGNSAFIGQYGLEPFKLNVLNKEQTMLEKLVSLIRFSFDGHEADSISKKIRHFYDLYFLMKDAECAAFAESPGFKEQFVRILNHDKELFDEPAGWKTKPVALSPLFTDFETIWNQVKASYQTELSALAFTDIPNEKEISESFIRLIKMIQ